MLSNLDRALLLILAIGGLNGGLTGLFDFNLISAIFGEFSLISKIIYGVIGFTAIYGLVKVFKRY